MEIMNCPECAAETASGGLVLWGDSDEPVIVFECQGEGCGWVGVATEYWAALVPAAAAAA